MNLRDLPPGLTSEQRCDERRKRVEEKTDADLSLLQTDANRIGQADEKNCEQMIGTVPLPVGIAGPLPISLSSGQKIEVFLPLATTEGALVASVNRGCKVLSASGGVQARSTLHGMSRSIVFKPKSEKIQAFTQHIRLQEEQWKKIGEATSRHLKILRSEIDEQEGYTFLTIYCDTSEAMGMNMTTIAAQAVGDWLSRELDADLLTVAANVDSDKKPSQRTHDRGRGYEVHVRASIPSSVIRDVLKTTPERLLAVADAKLRVGSGLAGALGANLHAANIIAALYLATGQDAAHVVEGSLADTTIGPLAPTPFPSPESGEGRRGGGGLAGIQFSVRLPALLVGTLGGGTSLPAQNQCLNLLLGNNKKQITSNQQPVTRRLAETIGAAVLAGEISLLAAQATQTLSSAHRKLAR